MCFTVSSLPVKNRFHFVKMGDLLAYVPDLMSGGVERVSDSFIEANVQVLMLFIEHLINPNIIWEGGNLHYVSFLPI